MKLQNYLALNAVKQKDFAAHIGEKPARICMYCLGRRIPRPDVMRKIFDATNGAVTPNDFFDLPDIALSPEVSAAEEHSTADGVAEGIAAFPADDTEPSFFDNLKTGEQSQ